MAVIFGLDSEQTEEEFLYEPAGDEWYTLRPINDEMRKSWARATSKGRKRNREGQQVEEFDEEMRLRLMVDHMFASWRGAVYLNKEDARAQRTSPCTLENKLAFAGSQVERMAWAMDLCQRMGEVIVQRITKERDNFREAAPVSA